MGLSRGSLYPCKHEQDIMASEEIRVVCACLLHLFQFPSHTIVVHCHLTSLSPELNFWRRWWLVVYLGQRTSAPRRSPATRYATSAEWLAGDAHGAQGLWNQHMPSGVPHRILFFFLYHANERSTFSLPLWLARWRMKDLQETERGN